MTDWITARAVGLLISIASFCLAFWKHISDRRSDAGTRSPKSDSCKQSFAVTIEAIHIDLASFVVTSIGESPALDFSWEVVDLHEDCRVEIHGKSIKTSLVPGDSVGFDMHFSNLGLYLDENVRHMDSMPVATIEIRYSDLKSRKHQEWLPILYTLEDPEAPMRVGTAVRSSK